MSQRMSSKIQVCEPLLKTNLQNFLAKDHFKQRFVGTSKARNILRQDDTNALVGAGLTWTEIKVTSRNSMRWRCVTEALYTPSRSDRKLLLLNDQTRRKSSHSLTELT